MNQRKLGTAGPAVSALGLGCMGLSDFYGPSDRAESIETMLSRAVAPEDVAGERYPAAQLVHMDSEKRGGL